MRHSLRVVPHMGAGAMAATASGKQPSHPHTLPFAWRRTVGDFRMREIGGDGIEHVGGKRGSRRARF